MSHVFVSYKKEDRRRVQRLVDGLTAEGFSVWWDVHIEGGAAWREEIEAKLNAAVCVVVIWSRASVGPEGHFVQDEAALANRRGVYLPVTIDAVSPPLGFGQQQVVPLVDWRGNRADRRFAELIRSVRAVIQTGEGAATLPPAPAVGRNWPAWTLWMALAAAAILGVIVAGPRLCPALGAACDLPTFVATAPANSIAVLPFANLSGDPGQTYFSDGLSEELLGRLARISQLQVAARTSSFRFRDSRDDSRAIAAKLGVAYILDGSVRRQGGHIRVSAHLIEVKTGFERWSQTYDRDFKDVFAVQSDIAEAVARALSIQLSGLNKAALDHGGTADPEPYDDYLRGRRLYDASGGEISHRDALAKFDAAIAADPRFAAAYSARARSLLVLANQYALASQLRSTYDEAIAAARKAVELAPTLAEAQATLADTLVYGTRDFAAAALAYQRALDSGGAGDAEVLLRYGQFECENGEIPRGLIALRRAVLLDPLNARAFKALGLGLIYGRQYPLAEAAMRRALELSPGINGARAGIGEALLLMGKPAEAESQYALEPENWQRLTGQAMAYGRLGETANAERAVKALLADGGESNAYQLAEIYAQWGRTDAALAALDTAFRIDDAGVELMRVDPLLDPLRRLSGFGERAARLRTGR